MYGAPNIIALVALASWPLITIVIFRKLAPGRAIIWSLLVAYLFLPPPPAAFDFPLMPALTKQTLPPVMAFLVLFFMFGREIRWLPRSNVAKILMVMFVVSPLATVLTNDEPVFWGQIGLPALRLMEAFALMVQQGFLLLPFIMGMNFLTREGDQRDLIFALVVLGLVYSILMLIEVRLSPQLNIWIYGYFQHNFEQMIRFGGFRPIVFLYHGLWVAFFALMVVAAAATLVRNSTGRMRSFAVFSTGYMWVVLVLCKSVASIAYSLVLVPLILFGGRLLQFRLAAALAFLAVVYPALRGAELVPTAWLVEQAASISPERANSLDFRFDNEAVLLERAELKPVFGWGSWGRNQILNAYTGEIETVTDGRWVITIGVFGWVGFLAEFGLLAWPVFVLVGKSFNAREAVRTTSPYLGPIALILGFNLFDLLPNATITTLTFLMSGMLLGHVEGLELRKRARKRRKLETVM
ncbi:hypothetical protein [Rhodalgimonas zhirmunskyi]|uniref:O-antigen ligase like membrane protein n=1 Tax=Rhodalgimonas zhirmunskyi TaxID=2964767 RepID=A0AAJ1X541_9RHOB|nr:hypothetical protein [Rhodoalgimonas zhirmunskyi]MDQ2093174.1 hypothetical protein [Rhodoalgimonas zhirmunskyi]